MELITQQHHSPDNLINRYRLFSTHLSTTWQYLNLLLAELQGEAALVRHCTDTAMLICCCWQRVGVLLLIPTAKTTAV